jgi:hypothetical protein
LMVEEEKKRKVGRPRTGGRELYVMLTGGPPIDRLGRQVLWTKARKAGVDLARAHGGVKSHVLWVWSPCLIRQQQLSKWEVANVSIVHEVLNERTLGKT